MTKPITIRMAPWVLALICAAAASFLLMSSYFFFRGDSYVLRYVMAAFAAAAIAAAADALASKMVLDGDTMHIVSLMRRRSFPRSEFVSAQVDRGVVVLKRKEGGWVILPGTGRDVQDLRKTIHAWVTSPSGV